MSKTTKSPSPKNPRTHLTEADKQDYCENAYGKCPFCKDHSIEGGSFDFEGNHVYQSVSCHACGASWADLYKLVSIEVLERPEQHQGTCARCGTDLTDGRCGDVTCPFSDYDQNDPRGWAGHPDYDKETQ